MSGVDELVAHQKYPCTGSYLAGMINEEDALPSHIHRPCSILSHLFVVVSLNRRMEVKTLRPAIQASGLLFRSPAGKPDLPNSTSSPRKSSQTFLRQTCLYAIIDCSFHESGPFISSRRGSSMLIMMIYTFFIGPESAVETRKHSCTSRVTEPPVPLGSFTGLSAVFTSDSNRDNEVRGFDSRKG